MKRNGSHKRDCKCNKCKTINKMLDSYSDNICDSNEPFFCTEDMFKNIPKGHKKKKKNCPTTKSSSCRETPCEPNPCSS